MTPYYTSPDGDIYHGKSEVVLPTLPDNSVDSIVTDPPYGLKFMGKKWDYKIPSVEVWRECLRVLKPGGFLLSFAGTRTQHRMACNIEDAGFEIRDMIAWVYGCLSEDTEILTINGWERYHKTIDKHPVLSYDIDNNTFEFQKPIRKFIYENKHTAYRIQSDSTDQIVSRNHNCIVEHGGKKVFERAEQVARKPEATVPFLESLSELPDNIFNSHEGTSVKKSILQKVCRDSDRRKEQREKTGKTNLPGLWNRILSTISNRKQAQGDLFKTMQRQNERGNPNTPQVRQDRNEVSGIGIKGKEKPSLERWSNLFQEKGQLWKIQNKICEMPRKIFKHVQERWIRYGTSFNYGTISKQTLNKKRSYPSHRPQPRKQQPQKPNAFPFQSSPQVTRITRAAITPFEYKGRVWCVQVPSGAFVARRNGKIFITGNSGFPKSLDISKAIDRAAGVEREVVGVNENGSGAHKIKLNNHEKGDTGIGYMDGSGKIFNVTAPTTKEAKQWEGFGTALKPALEPITVARKPFPGTVAANVLEWGTGGINIDGCRVENKEGKPLFNKRDDLEGSSFKGGSNRTGEISYAGRFPANLIHSGSPEVLGLFPETGKSSKRPATGKPKYTGIDGDSNAMRGSSTLDTTIRGHSDNGGSAARFFKSIPIENTCSLCCLTLDSKHNTMSKKKENVLCKNTHAQIAENYSQSTQATKEYTVQENVMLNQNEKNVRFVKYAGNLCDSCAIDIVQNLVAISEARKGAQSQLESQAIQGFITGYKKCTLLQNLVRYVENLDSIDTTQTTTSLLKLFGCVRPAIKSYIQKIKKSEPKRFAYIPKASKQDRGRGNNHPTVKPLALIQYLCRLVTPPGGTILDPFFGSGTLGVAAYKEGFKFIGIEQGIKNCEISKARIEQETKQFKLPMVEV